MISFLILDCTIWYYIQKYIHIISDEGVGYCWAHSGILSAHPMSIHLWGKLQCENTASKK